MNDLTKLLIGIVFGVLAQILTFFQLQGSTKFEWFKGRDIFQFSHFWLDLQII